jgi:DNA-binding NtrC family response regulator
MARALHRVTAMPNALEDRRLLLVEDDEHVARALHRLLSASGYHVLHVGTGDGAIDCLRRRTFDVVMTDLRLPGASGLEVLAAARAADANMPLVLMSGSPTTASASAAAALGVIAYLTKPIARPDLAEALQRAAVM